MTKNWAIAIGVSQYDSSYLKPQPSAQQDAEDICGVFKSAQFEQVYCFTQGSPDLLFPNSNIVLSTQPTYRNLSAFFELCFREPFLSVGDNLWFFFSGHGVRESDRHYLLPQDSNFLAVARTAFAVSDICNYLRCSGADNIILLLDADRSRSSTDASIAEPEQHSGVVSILACHPMQAFYSRDGLDNGVFTTALLEILRSQNRSQGFEYSFGREKKQYAATTPEQLHNHLHDLMTKQFGQINRGPGHPHLTADLPERLHYILFPALATSRDISVLKQAAYRCIQRGSLTLAEQICQRIGLALKPKSSILDDFSVRNTTPDKPIESRLDFDLERLQRAIQQTRSFPQAFPAVPEAELSDRAIPLLSLILEDSLASKCHPNYQPLRDLLMAQQWQAANDETRRLMCQAVGRQEDDLPTLGEMKQDLQNLLDNPPDDFLPEERELFQRLLQSLQQASSDEEVPSASYFAQALLQAQWQLTSGEKAALEMFFGLGNAARQAQEVEYFPVTDLFTLDHLWVKYSRGKFGFSIQKRLYFACGGTDSATYDPDVWNRFGDRIGWRVNGQWLPGDRNLTRDTILDGYFPIPNFSDSAGTVEFWLWWQLVQDA